MFERELFSTGHEIFRETVRRFVADEITPRHAQWEKDGQVSREVPLYGGAWYQRTRNPVTELAIVCW